MSRNSDKANTVLFRYQEQQAEANGYIDYNSTQRPRSVKKVTILKDAENWRKQVLQEISQKMLKISDEKLSDYMIRDLNDDLNKLMREKIAWEHHIKSLGGPDYIRSDNGRVAGGVVIRGYRYFGRAKELPGVKEILKKQLDDKDALKLKKEQTKSQHQKLRELEERADVAYYGYNDEVPRFGYGTKASVMIQAHEILGDLISCDEILDDKATSLQILDDELLQFERKATQKRTKKFIQDKSESIEVGENLLLIDDAAPPTQEEVEKFLVERRRRQLEQQLDV